MTHKIARWIATCGPIGFLPYAPGTAGSLTGVVLVVICQGHINILLTLTVVMVFVAVWSSAVTAKNFGDKDPSNVVIDEVCGILVTFSFFFVPLTWARLLVGFILFRLFDIFKPEPVRYVEKWPGGLGIVMDDVMAGIYANIVLQLLIRYAHL